MKGTVLYIYHDGSIFYDEVRWLPGDVTATDARTLALVMMCMDESVSHVHVEMGQPSNEYRQADEDHDFSFGFI